MFRRVKDHYNLLHYSLLKKTCFGQVVLDKWFPLILAVAVARTPEGADEYRAHQGGVDAEVHARGVPKQ